MNSTYHEPTSSGPHCQRFYFFLFFLTKISCIPTIGHLFIVDPNIQTIVTKSRSHHRTRSSSQCSLLQPPLSFIFLSNQHIRQQIPLLWVQQPTQTHPSSSITTHHVVSHTFCSLLSSKFRLFLFFTTSTSARRCPIQLFHLFWLLFTPH
jgi:hypothetical protein